MNGLQLAVGEVSGELELSDDRVRLFGLESSSFDLERQTEDVLATGDDELAELCTSVREVEGEQLRSRTS